MVAREAIIVAHGSVSEPLPQEQAMALLASRVSSLLPGWIVRGATLAYPESIPRAAHGLERPLIYPFFMAEGYLSCELLPRRLKSLGVAGRQLPPFGRDPMIPALASEVAMTGARLAGLSPEKTTLLLAAHGSQVSPASRLSTLSLAEALSRRLPFRDVAVGYIEERPYLADAARLPGPAICLPLFTLQAGHVSMDVPEALASAQFQGPVLQPLGSHSDVPGLIAAALQHQALEAVVQ